ncbi:YcaO-like family protein [Micromonospora sp. WMMD964]|uniref:YcaO-like family protein n=1 Tax=Micromonospora sp. WMMD964 TaxID=3016091 RepID=UPI00249B00B7|nr:YcaO-like family protein [Micromonospora sp. WMMD964]WFF02779.1 YcaO-like family protein [Micromonospora sp. WMMD964]
MNPESLDELVSPYGVVSAVSDARPSRICDRLYSCGAEVGTPGPANTRRRTGRLGGGGRSWADPRLARFVAIAEGAERYAMALAPHRREIVRATADELAGECLEPVRYPRCSARELATPGCPVRPFDPAAPIRWVTGLDLYSAAPVRVPAVMACRDLAPIDDAERFVHRLSTGHAVHTDPVEAVVRGALEVIERDAVAILWLQRLSLPTVASGELAESTRHLVDCCRRRFVDVRLLDATTDLGVPTVYCLLSAVHDPRLRNWTAASTGRTLSGAAAKALEEAVALTGLLSEGASPPGGPAGSVAVHDGARFMGAPERAGAFDFLLADAVAPPSPRRPELPADPDLALAALVERLAAAGARPVVVDRTTRELADVGLTAVHVVIPDLQPLSLHPLAQFTAHPRLSEAPARMGYRVLPEEELNPWPQPFA